MGPNLRRSWIRAWKKHKPKRSFLNASFCLQLSNHSGSQMGSLRYERPMLALSPLGGSLVILTPFCKTETGKWSAGYDVSQRRKSGWVTSGVSSSHNYNASLRLLELSELKVNYTRSRLGMKLLARWQFWRTTHVPFLTPSSINLMAIGPCPWPSDREKSLEAPNPWSSANFSRTAVGSAPGVSTKIRGMQQWESV